MHRFQRSMPSAGSWLTPLAATRRASLRLVCFPYAGGAPNVFRSWQDMLPGVDLWAVALPGRGTRLREPPISSAAAIAGAVADELQGLEPAPTAFFGHSLGALVAFEVARELRRRCAAPPLHLFASGARAPHHGSDDALHLLPDDAFMEKLRELNGTPSVVLENRELMALMLPAIRADFAVVETYRYVPESPLGIPLTTFGGHDDPHVDLERLEAWYCHTRGRFSLRMFDGDHFFLHTAEDEVTGSIMAELAFLEVAAA